MSYFALRLIFQIVKWNVHYKYIAFIYVTTPLSLLIFTTLLPFVPLCYYFM